MVDVRLAGRAFGVNRGALRLDRKSVAVVAQAAPRVEAVLVDEHEGRERRRAEEVADTTAVEGDRERKGPELLEEFGDRLFVFVRDGDDVGDLVRVLLWLREEERVWVTVPMYT
jgi:hypothetical protein